jgi:XTP/dITP diphosphohydrolase
MSRQVVTYVTSSAFKRDELAVINEHCLLLGSVPIPSRFDFDIREIDLKETLDVSLEAIVSAEARDAYAKTRVPVIVEHAGLIFVEHESAGYPGGLTKPMWNSLGLNFIDETNSAGRAVIARACIGYCDGQSVRTFVGETYGRLASEPRGDRKFYWDVLFVPDDDNESGLTYAEIVEDPAKGLAEKVLKHSQSRKAMVKFLEWRLDNDPPLWNLLS